VILLHGGRQGSCFQVPNEVREKVSRITIGREDRDMPRPPITGANMTGDGFSRSPHGLVGYCAQNGRRQKCAAKFSFQRQVISDLTGVVPRALAIFSSVWPIYFCSRRCLRDGRPGLAQSGPSADAL